MYLGALALNCSTRARGIFPYGMLTLSCSMWDLVPWPGIEHGPPALGAWSLSHWPTREPPPPPLFLMLASLYQGFSGGSDSKESACNVGDLGLLPGWGRSPGEGSAPTHSSILAWRIPWTRSLDRLQSMGGKELGMTEQLSLTLWHKEDWG